MFFFNVPYPQLFIDLVSPNVLSPRLNQRRSFVNHKEVYIKINNESFQFKNDFK